MTNPPVQPLSAEDAAGMLGDFCRIPVEPVAAIRDGHHVVIDTATHFSGEKMTEEQVRYLCNKAGRYDYQAEDEWIACARSLGAVK